MTHEADERVVNELASVVLGDTELTFGDVPEGVVDIGVRRGDALAVDDLSQHGRRNQSEIIARVGVTFRAVLRPW